MPLAPSSAQRFAPLVAGAVFFVVWLALDASGEYQVSGLFSLTAVIVAVSASTRWTVAASVAAMTAAAASGLWHDNVGESVWLLRLLGCLVGCVAAILAAWRMERYRHVLRHTTSLAHALLDALAVELTGARTVKEVASGFVGEAANHLSAASAMVFVLNDDNVMRSIVWMGRSGPVADQYSEFPLDADLPGAVAARSRTPRHFRNRVAIEKAFPKLRGYYADDRSLHVLPLVYQAELIGLLALTFPVEVISTREEEGLLESLSGALSAAISRARTLEAIDASAHRTQLLFEASLSLPRTLDVDSTLVEASRLLVPRLADWCVIHQLKDGQLVPSVVQHRDPDTTSWAWAMRDAFPTDMDATSGAAAVVRTGRSEVYPFVPRELLDEAAISDEHAQVLHRLGMVSAVIAPIRGRDGITGAISLAYAESGRRYTEDDMQFLEDVASLLGLALETATTVRRQAERLTDVMAIAEAAQLAILAPPPARIGPARLSARYLSAAEEAHVGGDFYEASPTLGRVRLLIGDVRGKGLPAVRTATIVMGEFRSTASQEPDVQALAKRLDQQLRAWLVDDEEFVTACLVDLGPDGTYEAVTCGHPPPFHVSGGDWQPLELEPAPPLGIGVDPVVGRGRLAQGDRLFLYTDGLLEARKPDGHFFDPDELRSLAAREPFDSVLDAILRRLHEMTSERLRDDLALFLAEYDPQDGSPR
ncbi:MAG: SpoIIE family protein phosphatase [Actinomycetes bacterium]